MFVLLEHNLEAELHWDLMLELPARDKLATWRLMTNPVGTATLTIAAEPIGDHRREYLDFEGDIGGGRGTVTRVDRGASAVIAHEPARLVVDLHGRLLLGRFEIVTAADGTARFGRTRHDPDPDGE